MSRQKLKWQLSVLFLGLSVCSVYAEQQSLTCKVRCSETKLRTGIAEIIWSSPAGVTAAGRKAAQAQLDVTVFHNGFKKGLYQSFGVIREGVTPQVVAGATRDAKAEERTRRAFDLKLRVPETDRDILNATTGISVQRFEIENLEPGLLYRFRVHNDGQGEQEVECEAPICPADMKEARP